MSRALAMGGIALGARPVVVAAGGEAEVDALAGAHEADAVELRADLFASPRPDTIVAALLRLRAAGKPTILTVRAAAEGGGQLIDDADRRALYDAGLAHADAIDVEIASEGLAAELGVRARAAGKLVILSAHVLDHTPPPSTLAALVHEGRAAGADIVKLATHARTLDDLRVLLAITLGGREHGIVTLAMGPVAGPLSRVVLPAAGSLLTYGHVGRATAPGQLPVAELAALIHRLFP